MAEAWNGTSWSVQITPNSNGYDNHLAGVSCTSATACTAVGDFINSSSVHFTLAERWNGTSWMLQTSAEPGEYGNSFTAVSCSASTACTAVGYDYSQVGKTPLAERWDGAGWSVQPVPPSPGEGTRMSASYFDGVSCASATACTAVGYYFANGGADQTLSEGWNGTSWSIQRGPSSAGTANVLNGVSCTAATTCTTAGYLVDSDGDYLTLAERWNGSSWVMLSTPSASGGVGSFFTSASCPSVTTCTAVGEFIKRPGAESTVAELWNGTSWAIEATPNPPGTVYAMLNGVSCASPTGCTAVGSFKIIGTKATLAEGWDGTSWLV